MSSRVRGTHQVFISSYQKDFPWLIHCLRSLKRFQHQFLPPIVCVDEGDWGEAKKQLPKHFPEMRIVIKKGERGRGFLRAQIAMMSCDLLSPDKADYYYLVGSDCVAYRQFSPGIYWHNGKPAMICNKFSDGFGTMWKAPTEQVLGFECEYETMRRLPIVYPKELFEPMRRHVEAVHKMKFEEFIYKKGLPLSESNILGSFAYKFMPELYTWMNAVPSNPEYVAYRTPDSDALLQMWSHGGLGRPMEANAEYLPGRKSHGKTPQEVINEILGPL